MKEHPINSLLDISLDNITRMVDVNKIIGQPIKIDDNNIIIPVSKVVFGFGAGGSEFNAKNAPRNYDIELSEELFPFGGGSGGGINITPVAFLKISEGKMNVMKIQRDNTLTEKLMEIAKDYFISKD